MLNPLFNASGGGSILLAALFHFQLINPLWPDAQTHGTLLFVTAAAAIVWVNRAAMFDSTSAMTELIPGPADSAGR
jgi:uncharacterized protein